MNGFDLALSISDVTSEKLASLAEAGIFDAEISLTEKAMKAFDYPKMAKIAAEIGVKFGSVHIPFVGDLRPLDPASLDRDVRLKTVDCFAELIRVAGQNGTGIAVIHPSLEPTLDAERRERIERARESFANLADVAAENGVVIAVEDLPRSCLGNCAEELDYITDADKRLRVCFDVNHLLLGTHVDFVKTLGKKIVTTHISDYDFRDERHWLPGEGKIEWQELVGLLEGVGYTGRWLYELNFSPDPKGMRRPRELQLSDIKKNYDEIMSGIKPTAFGKIDDEYCAEYCSWGKRFSEMGGR